MALGVATHPNAANLVQLHVARSSAGLVTNAWGGGSGLEMGTEFEAFPVSGSGSGLLAPRVRDVGHGPGRGLARQEALSPRRPGVCARRGGIRTRHGEDGTLHRVLRAILGPGARSRAAPPEGLPVAFRALRPARRRDGVPGARGSRLARQAPGLAESRPGVRGEGDACRRASGSPGVHMRMGNDRLPHAGPPGTAIPGGARPDASSRRKTRSSTRSGTRPPAARRPRSHGSSASVLALATSRASTTPSSRP